MNNQSADATHRRSSRRRPASFTLTAPVDGRPPARMTTAARRRTGRPTDEAAQLAYSEWLLAKLTA